MSHLYVALRDEAATAGVRKALAGQQRDWLHQRDTRCGRTPDVTCLGHLYQQRLEQLTGLDNAAAGSEHGRLDELESVLVTGEWEAGPLPSAGAWQGASVGASTEPVSVFNPPPFGQKIKASGSTLCVDGSNCQGISWRWSQIGAEVGASRLEQDLHLPSGQPILVGRPTTKYGNEVLLIPREHGAVSALASFCTGQDGDCRNVLQDWKPIGPVSLPAR